MYVVGSYFQPVPLEIRTLEIDKVGIDLISRTKDAKDGVANFQIDLQNLEGSMGTLLGLLDSVTEYVDNVAVCFSYIVMHARGNNRILIWAQSGKIQGDAFVGRALAKAVSALPSFDTETIDKIFNNNIQDLLMVVYLANLTRTQIALAEKLQKAL